MPFFPLGWPLMVSLVLPNIFLSADVYANSSSAGKKEFSSDFIKSIKRGERARGEHFKIDSDISEGLKQVPVNEPDAQPPMLSVPTSAAPPEKTKSIRFSRVKFNRKQLRQVLSSPPQTLEIPILLRRGPTAKKEKLTIVVTLAPKSLEFPDVYDGSKNQKIFVDRSLNYMGYLEDEKNQVLDSSVSLTFSSLEGKPYAHGMIAYQGHTLDLTFFKKKDGKKSETELLDTSESASSLLIDSNAVHDQRRLCDGAVESDKHAMMYPLDSPSVVGQSPTTTVSSSVSAEVAASSNTPIVNPGNRGPVIVDVFVDYKTYTDNGSSVQQTSNFVMGLMNAVSMQYRIDGLNVVLGKTTIYTSLDPYASSVSSSGYLYNFASDIVDGPTSTSPGHLAHFITTRTTNFGGLAYVDGLCSTNLKFAFSNIYNSFSSTTSVYSWSVNVVAHEIGHNLGSRHTHWCGWNVNGENRRLDKCAPGEAVYGAVECGINTVTDFNGTVMSYCHVNGAINPLMGFGTYPKQLISSKIAAAACLGAASAGDRSPPSVSIVSPKAGTKISNGVRPIRVTAVDDKAIQSIEIFFDGQSMGILTAEPYNFNVAISTSQIGNKTLQATATDTAGKKTSTSLSFNVEVDSVKPFLFVDNTVASVNIHEGRNLTGGAKAYISTAISDNIGVARFSVRLSTGELLMEKLDFSVSASSPSVAVDSSKYPSGNYWADVEVEDYAGNAVTVRRNFKITNASPPTPDTTIPTVAISSPINAAVVPLSSSTILVEATASDNSGGSGVAKVEFLFANSVVATDTSSPYSGNINISTIGAGVDFQVSARAVDVAGNVSSLAVVNLTRASVPPSDTTPPTVSFQSPANGATVGASVNLSASASDSSGILSVTFYYDSTQIGSPVTTPNAQGLYSLTWSVPSQLSGSVVLKAVAKDRATPTPLTSAVTRTVQVVPPDTVSPTVVITSPAQNAEFSSGSVLIKVNASDVGGSGLTKVDIFNGSSKIGSSVVSPPFQTSLNLNNLAVGSYSLTAKAYDGAGNVTSSSPVIITKVSATNPQQDKEPPTVDWSSFQSFQGKDSVVAFGPMILSVNAQDNLGVTIIRYLVDGIQVCKGLALGTPCLISSTLKNQTHEIEAQVEDAAGNRASEKIFVRPQ